MKRILALLLSCTVLLYGCAINQTADSSSESSVVETTEITEPVSETTETALSVSSIEGMLSEEEYMEQISRLSFNDPKLLSYYEDTVYSDIEELFSSDDYSVESVEAVYISKEYLEELAYNSQENLYFGYKLSDLDEAFKDEKYIFTIDDNGCQTVKAFEGNEAYDYSEILKNAAIGTGVIVVCVTIGVVAGAAGAATVSAVFLTAATTAVEVGVTSAMISGASRAIATGYETKDLESTFRAYVEGTYEGFAQGAVFGAVFGGASESIKIAKAAKPLKSALKSGNSNLLGEAGEKYAQKFFEGETQVSFLDGKVVPKGTTGATRPDITQWFADGTVKAKEVKNVALDNPTNYAKLKTELKRQISDRVLNLPEGSTQEIVLVTKGRNYSNKFVKSIIEDLQKYLYDVYGGTIPITAI